MELSSATPAWFVLISKLVYLTLLLEHVKELLARLPGFDEQSFEVDLGIPASEAAAGRRTPLSVRGVARALPVLLRLRRAYRRQLAADRRYVRRFSERKAAYDREPEELERLELPAFRDRYRELIADFYFETETSYFYTIYNASNAKLDFKAPFEAANRASGGSLDYLKLVGGLLDLSHLRPAQDLHARLARLRAEASDPDEATVRDFARRWKHQGRKVLDIRTPRWSEDLDLVREMIARAHAGWREESEPERRAREQHASYRAERARALHALRWRPLLRARFAAGLARLRAYAWWREEMRDHSTYAYYLVRLWTLEAARRLVAAGSIESADDVWCLTHQDVLAALEARLAAHSARERVRAARELLDSFRSFANPGEIGERHRDAARAALPDSAAVLRGRACSPGCGEGPARVARNLEEARGIQPGEVLVAIYTDPGWTPYFGSLAAVVTETGGLLSHAAVIAREYGLPAVLNVLDATCLVTSGDHLVVDGNQGTVAIVRRASPCRESEPVADE